MRRGPAVLTLAAAALVRAPTAALAKGAQDGVLRGPDVGKAGLTKLDHDEVVALVGASGSYHAIWARVPDWVRVFPNPPARTASLTPRP